MMVALDIVKASNARIAADLPAGLVAVFVGGTSGIGEYTLKELVRQAKHPRVYNIGRSKESSARIESECKALNPDAQYTFIPADISLIAQVDDVCDQIKAQEKAINMLFLSAGTLTKGQKTAEGLHFPASLKHFSRARFISNLLESLRAATGPRRVVSILTGTKEGEIFLDDFQGWSDGLTDLFKQRRHSSSIATLTLAHFARLAPTVSFVHDFPGNVKSNIGRDTTGVLRGVLAVFNLLGPLMRIPESESGERHVYFATSSAFPAAEGDEHAVALIDSAKVAEGIDGAAGSGVYTADQYNDTAFPQVQELLTKYKDEGMVEKIWATLDGEFNRISKATAS